MCNIIESEGGRGIYGAVLKEIKDLQDQYEVWGHGTSLENAKTINVVGFETVFDGLNRTAGCLPEDRSLLREVLEEWPFSDRPEALVLIVIPKRVDVDYSKWNDNYGWCVSHKQYMDRIPARGINRLKDEHLYGYFNMETGEVIRHESQK